MKLFNFVVSFCLLQFLVVDSEARKMSVDSIAPKVQSSLESNAITSKNSLHVKIKDHSAVTTQIFKDGVLFRTETAKKFDIPLVEGPNFYTLQATDAAQNQSPVLNLNNIILDTTGPVIATTVASNSFTNKNTFQVTIADWSQRVTSKVYRDGTLLATYTTKAFDVPLIEGANNFVIKSVDQMKNRSLDLNLTNVVLDSKPPVVSSSIASGSVVADNKIRITIADSAAVSIEIFKDGFLIGAQTAKTFDLALGEGVNNFILKASDAAGNIAQDFVLSNIVLDTKAPFLLSNVSSNSTVNSNSIQITIDDLSEVTTQVLRNGALIATSQSKSFSIPLVEGRNDFVLKAIDRLQNVAPDFVLTNISYVLDSTPPVLTSTSISNTVEVTLKI